MLTFVKMLRLFW